MTDLVSAFRQHFEIIPARTPTSKDAVFRLRYEVYCEELALPGFEASKFPSGLETDAYDERSAHYLMRHRPTGKTAGTVRLILSNPDELGRPFPLEIHAGRSFDPSLIDIQKLPRAHTAEISRLILAKEFRSNRGEPPSSVGSFDHLRSDGKFGRRHLPHPVLGLIAAVISMSAEYRITHWLAAMQPSLNRSLSRFDLQLTPIGPLVQFHGPRRPYFGLVDEVLAKVSQNQRDVWDLLTDYGRILAPPYEEANASVTVG